MSIANLGTRPKITKIIAAATNTNLFLTPVTVISPAFSEKVTYGKELNNPPKN